MKKDELYVERRPQGDYAVRRPNSQRASAVKPTQGAAIDRAREISPNSTPMVERVRHTTRGEPDQWASRKSEENIVLSPKPANGWFVLRVNGRVEKLRFGHYQEANLAGK